VQLAARSPFQLAFLRELDWETAVATLTNTNPALPTLTQTVPVSQTPATADRSAQITFSPLAPATGYTLQIDLRRRDAAGVNQTVITGTQSNLTINPGANTLNVALGATGQGELLVSVPNPSLPIPVIQANGGVVTRLSGTGNSGLLDGAPTVAQYRSPAGLTVDAAGNLYVADEQNNIIRLVDPLGNATSFAGNKNGGYQDGTGTGAQFRKPDGIVLAGDGNFYVADTQSHCIRVVDAQTNVSTLAGVGGCCNNGNVDGVGTAAKFDTPGGLGVNAAATTVFVADTKNNRIRQIDIATGTVSAFAGSLTKLSGTTDATGSAARFNQPLGLVVDASGNVYVADTGNNSIRKITPGGVVTTIAGSPTGASGFSDALGTTALFSSPSGVALDRAGTTLYVADTNNNCIRKVDLNTTQVTTLAGVGGCCSSGNTDGTGTGARFKQPYGIAVDANGALYVGDQGNNLIRKVE
jgi:sugar lactone lactonase YvrE